MRHWIVLLAFLSSACFVRGRGVFPAVVGAAIVTAAIVSASRPPPPRVIYVPESRPGYVWQAGYWTRDGDEWVWVEGRWVTSRPDYVWSPDHWEQAPDGEWHLIRGEWVHAPPPPPPAPTRDDDRPAPDDAEPAPESP